ncbi:MAG: protein translocase subunit SecD [Paracoccaceae bacterium]
MPCLVALWVSVPNFNYSNVEIINDAVLADGEAEAVQEVRKKLPFWPDWLPNKLINLGLDLRGGAQVLVEVILEDSYSENITGYWGDLRKILRSQRENIGSFRRTGQFGENLTLEFESFEKASQAEKLLTLKIYPVSDLSILKPEYIEVLRSGKRLTIELSNLQKESINKLTMEKSLEIIRRRVDEAGTREPSIQRQGDSRILVQVPGMGSAEELLQLIGKTARLTFHKVSGQKATSEHQLDSDQIILPDEGGNNYFILEQVPVVSGESLTNAQPSFDQNNRPAVSFQFNPTAGRKFGDYTKSNIGEPFAIVLDGVVISAPVIQSHIPGGTGIITGSFSVDESNRLAILLRAGALPAGIRVLEQRTVGPELGADSIQSGKVAAIVGGVFVLLFMIFIYRTFGLFANLALMINMVLIIAVLTTIGATLTLPGIAGIVLTIGMAVDANVIIFERIKEEIKRKKNTFDAVKNGYEMALSSIIDANVTTFIAAVVLFCFGSGPIKGFSITLGVGILTSVFTAIYVTRLFILMYLNWFKPKTFLV